MLTIFHSNKTITTRASRIIASDDLKPAIVAPWKLYKFYVNVYVMNDSSVTGQIFTTYYVRE